MRRTIIVLHGEQDWAHRFPDDDVVQRRLPDCAWVLRDGELWCVDRETALRVDAVLWRVGAIRPRERHRNVLDLIRHAGVPCVNPPDVLLRGFDRLGMLAELRAAGLPVIPFDVAIGDDMVRRLGRNFPLVVKAGNYHAGLGKVLVRQREAWSDVADLLFASEIQHLRADTLALDFLEQPDGQFVVLESNENPGLSGFPDETRVALADC